MPNITELLDARDDIHVVTKRGVIFCKRDYLDRNMVEDNRAITSYMRDSMRTFKDHGVDVFFAGQFHELDSPQQREWLRRFNLIGKIQKILPVSIQAGVASAELKELLIELILPSGRTRDQAFFNALLGRAGHKDMKSLFNLIAAEDIGATFSIDVTDIKAQSGIRPVNYEALAAKLQKLFKPVTGKDEQAMSLGIDMVNGAFGAIDTVVQEAGQAIIMSDPRMHEIFNMVGIPLNPPEEINYDERISNRIRDMKEKFLPRLLSNLSQDDLIALSGNIEVLDKELRRQMRSSMVTSMGEDQLKLPHYYMEMLEAAREEGIMVFGMGSGFPDPKDLFVDAIKTQALSIEARMKYMGVRYPGPHKYVALTDDVRMQHYLDLHRDDPGFVYKRVAIENIPSKGLDTMLEGVASSSTPLPCVTFELQGHKGPQPKDPQADLVHGTTQTYNVRIPKAMDLALQRQA